MNKGTLSVLFLVAVSGILGYYIGVSKISADWKNFTPRITVVGKEPPSRLKDVEFSLFWQVWDKIENNYYDKRAIDPEKLINGAISGMVEGLDDPYTVFLPPKQNSDFKQGMAGQFEGIGAELGMKEKQIIVVSPLDGAPAQKAGLRAGDAILKVDGQSTAGWTLSQAVDKIRGPKGTEVALAVLHQEQEEAVELKITRGTITVKSVAGWVKAIRDIENVRDTDTIKNHKNESVMYIRLSQFGDNTNKEWEGVVNALDLEKRKHKNVRGAILDLRNNPGGYLQDATFIASEFLSEGIVVTQEKGNGEKNSLSVNRKGLLLDIPIMVLINKGSASASEIVAGALRDHGRSKLVGETSFGKGTIQQAEDLGSGAGLHVTVAKWLTPKGTWVHKKGLTPDIVVEYDQKDASRDAQLEKAIEELVQ